VRRIGVAERRARLGVRHGLAGAFRAPDIVEVARDLVGLHATDPASVFLAVVARLPGVEVEAIERALYDERTVVRVLGMRRTMFAVPDELVPVVHAACTRAIVLRERRRLEQLLEQAAIAADGRTWLREVEEATVCALVARGQATGGELSGDVPGLREQVRLGEGRTWGGVLGISTRVLFLLAAEGRIRRGRPRGSWTSSQFRWLPVEPWPPVGTVEPAAEAARAELIRRWLRAFGPGTVADLRWWTGWTAGEVRQALGVVCPVEVEIDGGTGLVLGDDLDPVASPEPWVALLPALDPTVMGWIGRGWFLGELVPALFDRSGNAGPTVWCDGRVVGGWAQRRDGEVVFRLFEDVGSDAVRAVEAAAQGLAAWLGKVRVTPRFRTPLERELAS
jgi:hypothetical protein